MQEIIFFQTKNKKFGILIDNVQKVEQLTPYSDFNGPSFLMGEVLYRGEKIPLIDFASFLSGIPEENNSNLFLICQTANGNNFGISIETLGRSLSIEEENIVPVFLDDKENIYFKTLKSSSESLNILNVEEVYSSIIKSSSK